MIGMSVATLVAAGVSVSLFALSQMPPEAAEVTNGAAPVHFDNTGQLILAGITLLVGAFNMWMTWRKDQQAMKRAILERQWQVEDRKAIAEVLAQKTDQTTEVIVDHIEDNTKLTKEAAKASALAAREANEVNQKIAAIGEVRRAPIRKTGIPHDREGE